MKKLTRKELNKIAAEIIPIMPPAFEERKELLEVVSGIKAAQQDPSGTYAAGQNYRKYAPSIKPVNYMEKMKAANKAGGQAAVFGMFLFYCNKVINLVKSMDTVKKGELKNMRLVNYVSDPNFLLICKEFSKIAKGELMYKESKL